MSGLFNGDKKMSKIDIVYIGNKPKKKDTITGSRLVFPRHKAVSVENDIAQRLLDYPDVWVPKEDAEKVIAKQQAKDEAIAEQLAKQKAAQASADLELNMVVVVNEEQLDIAKYSSRQLDTLVEAEELIITAKKKPVPDYRLAIRDALREKNGTPELEEQE